MKVSMSDIKVGDVFKKYISGAGTSVFVAMQSLKQSKTYKNEYHIFATVLSTTGDVYEYMDEVYVTTTIKMGKVGTVEKIGVWRKGKVVKEEKVEHKKIVEMIKKDIVANDEFVVTAVESSSSSMDGMGAYVLYYEIETSNGLTVTLGHSSEVYVGEDITEGFEEFGMELAVVDLEFSAEVNSKHLLAESLIENIVAFAKQNRIKVVTFGSFLDGVFASTLKKFANYGGMEGGIPYITVR
jgi:hypothetical protein